MKFLPTKIPDVIIVEPAVFSDERGFFLESWQREKFRIGGIDIDFVQDNHSGSSKNVLRGLHYQVRRPQGKLVRVTHGAVFDVAVDIRRSSATFGHWVGEILSMENRRMMWVPPGFAHGFYVLSDFSEFQYKCTDYYFPDDEECIRWDDEFLRIAWPLSSGDRPLVSERDMQGKTFSDATGA